MILKLQRRLYGGEWYDITDGFEVETGMYHLMDLIMKYTEVGKEDVVIEYRLVNYTVGT